MIKKVLISLIFLFFASFYLNAQWARTYGGENGEVAYSIQQTKDGGYIVGGGFTPSMGGSLDFLILKLSASGEIEWQKTYGGTGSDYLKSIQQTNDGGYIAAGYTDSFGFGGSDFLVLKLSSIGEIEWQKSYGGIKDELAYSIQQTKDGGYIVVGSSNSFSILYLHPDFWVLKLSSSGEIEWQKAYGGFAPDCAVSVQQTQDGGYVVGGKTLSFSVGWYDFLVLKLSASGEIEWQKSYGGSKSDSFYSVQQTQDGGYVVGGITASFGAGLFDVLVLKLSASGEIEWQKTYGGSINEDWASMKQTKDGGYVVGGITISFGAGDYDFWVLKLSASGEIAWQKTYGGTNVDYAQFIQQTKDEGYIVGGWTYSFGAVNADILLLKLYPEGDIAPSCPLTGSSNAIIGNTSVSPVVTSITPQSTISSILNTTVIPKDSFMTNNLLCEAPKYILKISATTGGTTSPPPDSYTYYEKEKVQIEAIPDSGYRFTGWTGDVPSGHENDNPIIVTMDSAKSIKASFIRQYKLTISAGTGGTTNPLAGTYTYDSGTQVSIQATANSGYQFSGWSGSVSGTTNPINITMDVDKSITANFQVIPKPPEDGGKKKGCFIATAAYGSALDPHVQILRNFRNKYLMTNKPGQLFVKLYYRYSPPIADYIAKHKILKTAIRIALYPLIAFCYSLLQLD